MINLDPALLKYYASKYIWWKTPDEAVSFPQHVIAQVMNIGSYEDVESLTDLVGDDIIRRVLQQAEPGQFDANSWAYWHYRLNLAPMGKVPLLPRRQFL
ncbi:MAG: hypothetical protein HKL80_04435 [Acidimicrobiales bacterium]|nr:hypothetical protein [Acidimicrobiales bacterium]